MNPNDPNAKAVALLIKESELVQEAVIDLYLQVKVRSSEEVSDLT